MGLGIRRKLKQMLKQWLEKEDDQPSALPVPELISVPVNIRQRSDGDDNQIIGQINGDSNILAKDLTLVIYINGRGQYSAGVPFMVPPLPGYFLDRPEVLGLLKKRLLEQDNSGKGALIVGALFGLGGVGKSVLAAALARSPEVQTQFPNGVLWVTLGQEPDLLSSLSGWIQALGDDDFKGTTPEMASSHLQTLLSDKAVLLVVDDAWDAKHVQHFWVGGDRCRMLVTTREVMLPGVEKIEVDSLNLSQSLELLERVQRRSLTNAERPITAQVAAGVGRLPLALELVGALVAEGMSWQELSADLTCEIKRLEVLDLDEGAGETVLDHSNEKTLKQRSLQASFNLSLRRLGPERQARFAWLGLLPEDRPISAVAAAVLWNLEPRAALRELRQLRSRALLLEGPEVLLDQETELRPTYKLHDLMHHTARNLILASPTANLPGLGLSWAAAHGELLQRYRQRLTGGWATLPDDGYIHRHLSWHFVKAGWDEELHALLAEETPENRNAWYEATDRLGLLGNFVEDVARAWECAEALFSTDPERSLGLQCRYAITIASIQSLSNKIHPQLMAVMLKHHAWSPLKVFEYIQQVNDSFRQAEALREVIPYLPEEYLSKAENIANSLREPASQIWALLGICSRKKTLFSEVLTLLQEPNEIQQIQKGIILIELCKIAPPSSLGNIIQIKNSIQDDSCVAEINSILSRYDEKFFEQSINFLPQILDQDLRAKILVNLCHVQKNLVQQAKQAINEINQSVSKVSLLVELYKICGNNDFILDAHKESMTLLDAVSRAQALILISHVDTRFVRLAYNEISIIEDPILHSYLLTGLAIIDPDLVPEVRFLSFQIRDDFYISRTLVLISEFLSPDLTLMALEVASEIRHEKYRMIAILSLLDRLPSDSIKVVTAIVQEIGYDLYQSIIFSALGKALSSELVHIALNEILSISDDRPMSFALIPLIDYLPSSLLTKVCLRVEKMNNQIYQSKVIDVIHRRDPHLIFDDLNLALAQEVNSLSLPKNEDFQEWDVELWQSKLRSLTHQKRSELMPQLGKLAPVLLHLGGESALAGLLDSLRTVCRQWP